MDTASLSLLEQALHERRPRGDAGLVAHSDRGSQYLALRYTERLADTGIEPSVGSVGDSYDNALAETIIGLFKAEVIHRLGPWKTADAVEWETLKWVDWYNTERLHSAIGYVTPQEKEEAFYADLSSAEKAPFADGPQTGIIQAIGKRRGDIGLQRHHPVIELYLLGVKSRIELQNCLRIAQWWSNVDYCPA